MRLDIPGGPPDLLAPRPPLDAVGGQGKRSTKTRQRLISVLYTVLGVGLFFAAWWCAASQLPRSRLVTPLDAGRDIWANFFYSPRLGVFGLGEVGYGSLLLYTVGNVLVGLVIGGAIGILIGTASARLKLLRVFVDPVVLVLGTVPVLVAATGMTLVILLGQIDVSIGAQFALCAVAAAGLAKMGWPMPVVLLASAEWP